MDENGFDEAVYDARFGSLTPAEHKILHLIGAGYQAKEIERRGGGSYNRVNTLTREVRRRLGPLPTGDLIDRRELARAYRAWETRQEVADSGDQRIDVYSVDVPKPPDSGSDDGVDHKDMTADQGSPIAEEQQPYVAQGQVSTLLGLVPVRTAGRAHNDLTFKATMIVFAILFCLLLIAAGSTASLLEAFNSLARS